MMIVFRFIEVLTALWAAAYLVLQVARFLRMRKVGRWLPVLLLCLPLPAQAHMFCNMDNSEATLQAACLAGTSYNGGTILFADDLEDGLWMHNNSDDGGPSEPLNDGWRGTISPATGETYPKYAVCGGAGVAGTDCTADSGHIDGNGVDIAKGFDAKHEFYPSLGSQYTNVYFRYYFKQSSDYEGGLVKYLFFQNDTSQCCPLVEQSGGNLDLDFMHGSNIGWKNSNISLLIPEVNKWYYLEAHVNVGDAGVANGVYELWMDDCGTDGLGCTGTPTLRAQHTGQIVRDLADETLSLMWIENWGNPGAYGKIYYDQMVASTAFIGFADSGTPPAEEGPASGALITIFRWAPVAAGIVWHFRQAILAGIMAVWMTGGAVLAITTQTSKRLAYKTTITTVTGMTKVLDRLTTRTRM